MNYPYGVQNNFNRPPLVYPGTSGQLPYYASRFSQPPPTVYPGGFSQPAVYSGTSSQPPAVYTAGYTQPTVYAGGYSQPAVYTVASSQPPVVQAAASKQSSTQAGASNQSFTKTDYDDEAVVITDGFNQSAVFADVYKHVNIENPDGNGKKFSKTGVFLSRLPVGVTKTILMSVIKTFGKVRSVNLDLYSGTAAVEFEERKSAELLLLKNSIFILSKQICIAPLIVAQESSANKSSKHEEKERTPPQKEQPEKSASKAVPRVEPYGRNKTVIAILEEVEKSKVSNLDDKLIAVAVDHIILKDSSLTEKLLWLVKDIKNCLPIKLVGCDVNLIGSAAMGLLMKGDHIEVSVQLSREVSQVVNSKKIAVTMINNELSYVGKFGNVFGVFSSCEPMVVCVHKPTQFVCHLTINDITDPKACLKISSILRLNLKIRILIIFIMCWARGLKMIDKDKFSSYAIVLLVVFYLQQIQDAMVPAIRLITKENISEIGRNISNKDSLRKLTEGFFRFYSEISVGHTVLSPYVGAILKRNVFLEVSEIPYELHKYAEMVENGADMLRVNTPIVVQDPYNVCKNVTERVSDRTLAYFKFLCRQALEMVVSRHLPTLLTEHCIPSKDINSADGVSSQHDEEAINSAQRRELALIEHDLKAKGSSQHDIQATLASQQDNFQATLSSRVQPVDASLVARQKAKEARSMAWRQAEEAAVAARRQAEEAAVAAQRQAEEAKVAARRQAEEAELAARRQAEEAELAARRRAEEAELAARRRAEAELAARRRAEAELAARQRAEAELVARRQAMEAERKARRQMAEFIAQRKSEKAQKARLVAQRQAEEAELKTRRQAEEAERKAQRQIAEFIALRKAEKAEEAKRDFRHRKAEETKLAIRKRMEEEAKRASLRRLAQAKLSAERQVEEGKRATRKQAEEDILHSLRHNVEVKASSRQHDVETEVFSQRHGARPSLKQHSHPGNNSRHYSEDEHEIKAKSPSPLNPNQLAQREMNTSFRATKFLQPKYLVPETDSGIVLTRKDLFQRWLNVMLVILPDFLINFVRLEVVPVYDAGPDISWEPKAKARKLSVNNVKISGKADEYAKMVMRKRWVCEGHPLVCSWQQRKKAASEIDVGPTTHPMEREALVSKHLAESFSTKEDVAFYFTVYVQEEQERIRCFFENLQRKSEPFVTIIQSLVGLLPLWIGNAFEVGFSLRCVTGVYIPGDMNAEGAGSVQN